jgi:hypothetical protein
MNTQDPIDMEIEYNEKFLGLFEMPHAYSITPEMHQAAIAAAIERAKQEQFEADVKAQCWICRGESELQIVPLLHENGVYKTYEHSDRSGSDINVCFSNAIRLAYPARSAVMDTKRQSVTPPTARA